MTRSRLLAYVLPLLALAPFSALGAEVVPVIDFDPKISVPGRLKGLDLAHAVIAKDVREQGKLTKGASLELNRIQESLLGSHYHFKQVLNGLDVIGGEVIVSVNHEGESVVKTFSRVFDTAGLVAKAASDVVGTETAFDKAWDHLKASGNLMENASAKLAYYPIDGVLKLAYVTQIAVSAPFGYWQQIVDAESGKVLETTDRRLERVRTSFSTKTVFSGAATDRKAAFAAYDAKAAQQKRDSEVGIAAVATGSALVFDPDPRTTLNDNTLEDESAAAAFEAAYFTRTLQEITQTGNQYRLTGPWITIADFETPTVAPSTTTNGRWTTKRGTGAFNDAMTYFHIDQNQRYMQSLGFTGQRGIQYGSIQVDADGLDGDDNSHFIPDTNRISFGHGCVDDNEDADVILHEYGHAIQESINSNWGGGDTGAMGEGFGDYWGASYSYSTANGSHFFPAYIFNWDGHGTSNACWPGRTLDKTAARYVAGRNYQAHTPIAGGFQSDELWSTPLFQSFLALVSMGVPQSDVDKIVLESHFGLGAGMTMPNMARATVAAATRLFPNGPHAGVFTTKFRAQGILP